MIRTILHAITAIGILAAPFMVTAQSSDNFYGTRTLNPAKSKYSPGPAPTGGSLKVTMAPAEGGFKMIGDSVSPTGESRHTEVFATFDGKDHPLGDDGHATIAFRKIDDKHYGTSRQVRRTSHNHEQNHGIGRRQDAHHGANGEEP